ncbi:MAG: CBS domain-containing protein [Saprospiraceae bacterium]|nr:CBS domain-containing protein [Lewinella sp.]
MGELRIKPLSTHQERSQFCRAMLRDVQALEIMLREGLFEKGIQRIGAEQELCLVRPDFSPAITGPEILSHIDDDAYTSEIARYNLEINLLPHELGGKAFEHLHHSLDRLLNKGQAVADQWDTRFLLAGILPTIERRHLQPEYMTPAQRYLNLSEKLLDIRGEAFKIQLEGVDELIASLDSVLFEACNTSFQLHLQIAPEDFVAQYNWAQMIAGPVLAISANSPLLLGRELWMETRIALFKQSLDTRNPLHQLRDKAPRVNFGTDWIHHSVADIFKDNIARFPMLLGMATEIEDSLDVLHDGGTPALRSLRLHNGTTYTWNRPCYGIGDDGQAHLRIECRYLPAGPSVLDEMANFAFWVGLMKGMPEKYRNLKDTMDFRVAKANFIRAARTGIVTSLEWEGKLWSAPELVSRVLLPMAEQGLRNAGVSSESITYYLGVIEDRCMRQQSGSRWIVQNYQYLRKKYSRGMAISLITEAMGEQQQTGLPVHHWDHIRTNGVFPRPFNALYAKDIMSTDLFTVNEEESMALTERIIHWRTIRHLPIENSRGELVGILTHKQIEDWSKNATDPFEKLHDDMVKDPVCAAPYTTLAEIRDLMIEHNIGCVPIVVDKHLVGMVTDTDMKRVLGTDDLQASKMKEGIT